MTAYDSRLAAIDLKIEKLDGRITLVAWQFAALIVKAFA